MATPRTESVRRVRRCLPLGTALLVVAVLATGCGGGDQPTKVAVGAAGVSAPTTVAVSGASAGEPCGAITTLFLTALTAQLDTDEDATGEDMSDAEGVRLVRVLAQTAPAELADAAERLAHLMEQTTSGSEPDTLDFAGVDEAITTVTTWGVKHCHPAKPVWKCGAHRSFTAVGRSIDADAGGNDPTAKATPEAILATVSDHGHAVPLDQSADARLYGWLDADGMVVRTVELERQSDGRWRVRIENSCPTADEQSDPFSVVGSDIGPSD